MGAGREAIGATKDIEANRLAAHTAERADIMAGITGAGKFAQAFRPVGGAGAGGAGKVKLNEQLAAAEVAHETKPTPETLKTVTALRRAVAQVKDIGPEKVNLGNAANDVKYQALVQKGLGELQVTPKYLKATPEQQKVMEAEVTNRIRSQPLPQDGVIDLNDRKAKGGIISPIKLD
jgi:hypothetical protein